MAPPSPQAIPGYGQCDPIVGRGAPPVACSVRRRRAARWRRVLRAAFPCPRAACPVTNGPPADVSKPKPPCSAPRITPPLPMSVPVPLPPVGDPSAASPRTEPVPGAPSARGRRRGSAKPTLAAPLGPPPMPHYTPTMPSHKPIFRMAPKAARTARTPGQAALGSATTACAAPRKEAQSGGCARTARATHAAGTGAETRGPRASSPSSAARRRCLGCSCSPSSESTLGPLR